MTNLNHLIEMVKEYRELVNREKEYKKLTGVDKRIQRSLNKIHKLKQENKMLSARRESIVNGVLFTENIYNIFQISERIGKNGLRIQHLRTKISKLKIEMMCAKGGEFI